MSARTRRIGENEALARRVNEGLEGLNETFSAFTHEFDVVCECGKPWCVDRIRISPGSYAEVRADPRLFIVVPGHEAPDVEEVVDRQDRYDVVRKSDGLPARIAEATDPRS